MIQQRDAVPDHVFGHVDVVDEADDAVPNHQMFRQYVEEGGVPE